MNTTYPAVRHFISYNHQAYRRNITPDVHSGQMGLKCGLSALNLSSMFPITPNSQPANARLYITGSQIMCDANCVTKSQLQLTHIP